MAETKSLEREYTIPLRKFWLRAPEYERGRKAVLAIKKFIAKHMKVLDRDIKKVKLDIFFNNELWFRGRRHPPAKVRVKAKKEGDIVKVDFIETPQHVKFQKAKLEKLHRKAEKKPEEKKEEKPAEKPEETKKQETKKEEVKTETEEKKVEEKEKGIAVAEQHAKEAKLEAKAQKHLTKKKEPSYHRMALQK